MDDQTMNVIIHILKKMTVIEVAEAIKQVYGDLPEEDQTGILVRVYKLSLQE